MVTTEQRAIMVGVDGSETARRALRWAVEEGGYRNAEVRAVIAWTYVPFLLPGVYDPPDARRHAERVLEQEVAGALTGLVAAPVVVQVALEGSPAQVLAAASADAAMLVVGTHGHGALGEVLTGSVSTACVRQAAGRGAAGTGGADRAAPPVKPHDNSAVLNLSALPLAALNLAAWQAASGTVTGGSGPHADAACHRGCGGADGGADDGASGQED